MMQEHVFRRCLSFVVVGLILLEADAAIAHHSITPYDQNTFSELEGVISAIRWRNPHLGLRLMVENDTGEQEVWELEGDSVNAAARRGLTREGIRVGDRVRVAGWPSRRGRRELFAINILLPNGEETILTDIDFPLRWTEERAIRTTDLTDTDLGRSIFRVWSFGALYRPRMPFVLTPPAEAARSTWDPSTDMLALRCIAPGMPNAILNPYPIEFIDEGDQIRLEIEEWEATRMIDMTSRGIPADAPTSPLGYSVGRFEGNTLLIETARIDFPYLDDGGTPMSDQVEMVERFTVSEDGSRLNYKVSVTDPPNLVEPAIWDAAWSWVPGTEIRPYECDVE